MINAISLFRHWSCITFFFWTSKPLNLPLKQWNPQIVVDSVSIHIYTQATRWKIQAELPKMTEKPNLFNRTIIRPVNHGVWCIIHRLGNQVNTFMHIQALGNDRKHLLHTRPWINHQTPFTGNQLTKINSQLIFTIDINWKNVTIKTWKSPKIFFFCKKNSNQSILWWWFQRLWSKWLHQMNKLFNKN